MTTAASDKTVSPPPRPRLPVVGLAEGKIRAPQLHFHVFLPLVFTRKRPEDPLRCELLQRRSQGNGQDAQRDGVHVIDCEGASVGKMRGLTLSSCGTRIELTPNSQPIASQLIKLTADSQ